MYLMWLIAFMFSQILMAETNLVIIRHGEAENNIRHVYNSNPNHPNYFIANLTQKGKDQAHDAAKKLMAQGINNRKIQIVYVSPLPRTLKTAHILADSGLFSTDKIVIDENIIERQMGDLESKPIVKIEEDEVCLFNVESQAEVINRAEKFICDVKKNNSDGYVIVVTHKYFASILTKLLSDNSNRLENCEFVILPFSQNIESTN